MFNKEWQITDFELIHSKECECDICAEKYDEYGKLKEEDDIEFSIHKKI